jgi:diacylglycerol kinase family enzyme
MVGIGFDAFVANAIGERFERGSRMSTVSYTWQLLRSLFAYRSQPVKVALNGQDIRSCLFTLAAGIGQYNGGGMKQCPQAKPDDGLLDVTIVDHATIPVVIANIHRLFNGQFIQRKEVTQYQTKHLDIEASNNLLVEADGELLGKTPATINIIEKRLRVIIPSQ